MERVYFTILIYLKVGQQAAFDQYENLVLPLLPGYNGKLEFRLKTKKDSEDEPDEIHVISFSSYQDFENYKLDDIRKANSHLAKQAIHESVMIEGTALLKI